MRLVLYTCPPLAFLTVRALPSLVRPSSVLHALFSSMCAPSMPYAPSPHLRVSFLAVHAIPTLVRAFSLLCTPSSLPYALSFSMPPSPIVHALFAVVRTLPIAMRALNRLVAAFVYQHLCFLLAASKMEYVREMGLHFICNFVSWISFVGSLYETIGILKYFKFFSF